MRELSLVAASTAGRPVSPGWRPGELFEGIDGAGFECVRRCLGAHVVEFSKRDRIASERDDRPRIGVLLSGVALDASEHADGTSSVLDVIEPGGLFGDGWDSAGGASRVLVAAGEGRAVLLGSERLVGGHEGCGVRPRLVDNLLRAVLAKNERLRGHLELVSRRTLRERLIGYLRGESERVEGSTFTIPLSRAELADFLHADRAAVSRELSRMRDDGLVAYDRSTFALTRG
ncbi:Crp/Fnr family transcriptional regulator [Pseudoclavibacter chungangensis]|uniref:Crp/Fnr family transcriptional regulator n=1 Tax=Pseudoclavibacter chungangensis TaxID=587635 RepID=A0A7J5BP56_9MICO|nr:Crp/Fnr family transcriptional regulator [Pseudoclavibacter chungangensis]KAB1654556.1 Crp/Fnr family transcriptional regulator [Pseudoclavibacter chungangensis]NYJ68210.1 CRP-like cAMP-binding protein [Pseudoclavibacter chungangensis]